MKYFLPLIIASFVLAIVMAMFQQGPLTLPYLSGFVMGIVVPVVVYTGTLTLLVAGVYRLTMGRDIAKLSGIMWGIWVLVAAVNFFANIQHRGEQLLDSERYWTQQDRLIEWQLAQGMSGKPPAVLELQARFVKDSRQLDTELASKVAALTLPALFNAEFLKDKSAFSAAVLQLKDYAQLFQQHIVIRRRMVAKMKTEIEQLDMAPNEIQQAVQEFNNTYEIDRKLSEKYFDIVIDVARQGIAYLDFLRPLHYRVINGQVEFESDAETEQYRAFLQTFQGLSQQEVATQQELAESREQRMARLRELSP